MLHMEEKTSIILSHRREGMSIREIARRNGMSRKTVRKYLREFDRETGPSPTEREVDDYLLTRPKYDSSGRVRRVVTDDVRRRIDGFIARNRENVAAGLHSSRCASSICGDVFRTMACVSPIPQYVSMSVRWSSAEVARKACKGIYPSGL